MNKSIALIAAVVLTISGAVNAATSQTTLLDKTASTSPSTIWTTGELGFVQNPAGVTYRMVGAEQVMSPVDSSIDVSAKTSPSTTWSFGETGYIQNPNYTAAAKGEGFSVAMARSQAMALQSSVNSYKDISITF